MVAAYLVGTRGSAADAVLLGLTVTVTHTAGVFALGLATLGLSAWILPEQLYPWLTLASGLLVVVVGAGVLRGHLRARRHAHDRHRHEHHHGHGHGTATATDTATATATATATIISTRRPGGGCSRSGRPRASSPARPRSSCCSRRSRSTASATDCC